MLPKMSKDSLPRGEKGPSREGKKHVHNFFFSRVEVERFDLPPPPLGSPMSESDNKINNIFRIFHHKIISKYPVECTQCTIL